MTADRFKFGKGTLAAVVAAGALLASGQAFATPTITISAPGESDIVIQDGGAGDTNATAGIIGFSVSIGSFSSVGSAAFTKPALGSDALQLDTVFSALSNSAGEVTFAFSETGFDASGNLQFVSSIGGTTEGTVNYDTYVDDSDALNGQATQVGDLGPFSGPGAFAFSGTDSGAATVNSPFSMTQVITVNHAGAGVTDLTTGNANLQVPLPATLGLLGMGLIGLGAVARRRTASA